VFPAAVREFRLVGSMRLMARAKPLRHLVSRPTYRGLSALASRQSKFGMITLAVDLCRILTIEPDEQTGLTDVWRRSHYEANCQSCQTAGLSSILLLQRKKRRPLGRLSGSGGWRQGLSRRTEGNHRPPGYEFQYCSRTFRPSNRAAELTLRSPVRRSLANAGAARRTFHSGWSGLSNERLPLSAGT